MKVFSTKIVFFTNSRKFSLSKVSTIRTVWYKYYTSGKGVTMHYPLSLVMYPDKDLTIVDMYTVDLFLKSGWDVLKRKSVL